MFPLEHGDNDNNEMITLDQGSLEEQSCVADEWDSPPSSLGLRCS